jgi:hypothetical protein
MEQEIIINEDGKVEEILTDEGAEKPLKVRPNVSQEANFKAFKKKRDIFRFHGEKDISINLEHVTTMFAEGNRLTFQFYTNATFVDLEDEVAAKRAYEQIVGIWSADAIE